MKRLMILTACLLAGCAHTGVPVGVAMEKLNQRYSGQPADAFFSRYGKPAGKPQTGMGEHTYRWVSIQPSEQFTGEPSPFIAPTGQFLVPAHAAQKPNELICQLAVHTDGKGLIRSLVITLDTEGKHSNSRCGEIFRPE